MAPNAEYPKQDLEVICNKIDVNIEEMRQFSNVRAFGILLVGVAALAVTYFIPGKNNETIFGFENGRFALELVELAVTGLVFQLNTIIKQDIVEKSENDKGKIQGIITRRDTINGSDEKEIKRIKKKYKMK